MKNILIVLAITVGYFNTDAQEFKTTEEYTLTNERLIGQEENGSAMIDLVLSDDTSTIITALDIADLDLLHEVQISVLTAPNLEGITEILKIELAYDTCCTGTDTYYFLVSEDQHFTALPSIENLYCKGTNVDTHYIFPSQEYGQEGIILRVEKQYTEMFAIKDIEVMRSIVWNDDDFEYEEAINATELVLD